MAEPAAPPAEEAQKKVEKKRKLPPARIRRSRAELEALVKSQVKLAEESGEIVKQHAEKRAKEGALPPPAEETKAIPAVPIRPPLRPVDLRGVVDKYVEARHPGYRWQLAGAAALTAGAFFYMKAPDIVMGLGASGLF